MFSKFFIDRPIFATVLSLIILLAGAISIPNLPIAQYPELTPPSIAVSCQYPGASAEVLGDTVAPILEEQINGVDDMIYMSSTSSSSGELTLTVSFEVGTDPDQALINVNNRVQAATPSLPEEVRRQGVDVRKRSSTILGIARLFSPDGRYDTIYLSNYALVNVVDELRRIPGVGDAVNFLAQDYAMRVWLKPDRLKQMNLTPQDVIAAISEQNAQYAAGRLGQPPVSAAVDMVYTFRVQGRLETPQEFENIILRANSDGSTLLLKDVASVELGAQTYNVSVKGDGKPSVPIGIFLSPGANALAAIEAVEAKLAEIATRFPEGISADIPYDTTSFVEVSINEVVRTLIEAMCLVFIVVYVFLQDWRATLIPCVAVPVSIIGAFAGMLAMGFSINTLTLFGLVLAIGIVVDDAIVVIENVERIMRTQDKSPRDATIQAMEEVAGPVIAIVLVLCSVFIPVTFLGGMSGVMYRQFAITITVSVAISGLVALTLTPALCALLLKAHLPEKKGPVGRFFDFFNRSFDRLTDNYVGVTGFLTRRAAVALGIMAVLMLVTYHLFSAVPGALAPDEDQGYVITAAFLPEGSSLARTATVMDTMDDYTLRHPAVKGMISLSGYDLFGGGQKSYAGVSFVTLKPWDERKEEHLSSFSLTGQIMGAGFMNVTDGMVLSFNPPAISGMSNTGGFEGYIQSRGGGTNAELVAAADKFLELARQRPELSPRSLRSSFSITAPQLAVDVDRVKARALGVSIADVFTAMQAMFGSVYVNDFNMLSKTFKVMVQASAEYRSDIAGLRDVYVRSQAGDMIPLASLVTVTKTMGTDLLERYNAFPATKISGDPAPGYSSGQALQAVEEVAAEVLSKEYSFSWTGSAYQEKLIGDASTKAFLMGIVVVFLILAAQYERWSLPIAVLMAVPFAMFGAILAVYLRGQSNDIYFQIALITLVGLAAKNAILIVEFALLQMSEGKSLIDAALEGARLRFRPIIMTSLAFILGCMPLAISSGAGSASRHSIGTGVVGGMLAATFIAILFIPLFFRLIMGFGNMFGRK